VIRSLLFVVWAILSTAVYGMACTVLSVISMRAAWRVAWHWSKQLLFIGGVRATVTGTNRLAPNGTYVVVSNHASAFDIPILMATLPLNLAFMAKKELFRIPVFGWGITAMGHIPVDRSSARKARQAIRRAVDSLHKENDISLLLFPEGTRSPDGRLGEFKSASFALALEAGVDVVPVYIHNSHRILRKKTWRICPGTVEVRVGEPIAIHESGGFDKKGLSERAYAAMVALRGR
jgi:1-acyl-sn-glycerol-3-phosphate acyltransferase